MTCRPAPAVACALTQADVRWPSRADGADGTCASEQHHQQNPGSDHEPGPDGLAEAFDLTDDPDGGPDTAVEAERLRLRRDPRIKYVICDRRMFSSYGTSTRAAWTWGEYHGADPHTGHMHVSIVAGARYDTSSWWEDDDMALTPDVKRELIEGAAELAAVKVLAGLRDMMGDVNVIRDSVAGRRTPTHDNPEDRSATGRIEDQVNRLAAVLIPPPQP